MDTIFVLNSKRQVIDVLSNNGSNPSAPFFDDTYKSELDTGAESYEFTTINNTRTNATLEVGNYVLFKYNGKYKLFQIMETTDEHSEGKKLLTVYAEMAGMELRNDYCEPLSVEGNFITFLNTVLQDTSWSVGLYSESLLNNIQLVTTTEPQSVYSLIQNNLSTFGGVEIEFRVEFVGNQLAALLIDCYEAGTRGNRTYRRFEYGEDVKGITRNRNINDLATAVIGVGKNNVDFKDIEWDKSLGNPCDKPLQQNFVVDVEANDLWNNGGKYIKTVYKSDTEDPATLLQEAWDHLQEIKQPKFDYDVDLALIAEDYLDINVGDTNYVVDFDYNPPILLEARVGTLEISFANARDNKCTLTNYKELVSILTQPVDFNTVGNMIQSHFPIGGKDIAMGAIGEGHIDVTYYQAIKTDFLTASLAEVETLIADKADIADLTAINADIENLRANKADITDLNAANGNITNLTSQVGQIETIINGHFTGTDAQVLNITAQNTTFDNAVIKDAMIDTVSANKVNTGTLNTNNVNIESEDGGIKISGTTQQFKDKEGHVRVQIGKDAQGNFTFCLFSQDGQGILLDETGIKAGAVPNGLIVNDMVSDSANISGSKLDISSVITQINNNETTINSSHIKFDDTGQSLLVAFNQLKNQVDTIEEVTISGDLSSVIEKVNTHTTQIGVMQGQISSLISNTTITKEDGTVTQLKDEYNSTKDTVNSHTTKIGSLETNYNKVSGDLASVTSKQSTLEQTLDEVSSTLTSTTTTANEAKTQASTNKQSIDSMSTTLTSTTKTANEAKTQASTNKQTIDSMSTTLTSTTNTANSALSKATTAQQNLDGFKTTVSNTYTTKTDFNNLSIGGRNLLKDSKTLTKATGVGSDSSTAWIVQNTGSEGFKKLQINTASTDWIECHIPLYSSINTLTQNLTISFEYKESTSGLLVFSFSVHKSDGTRIKKLTNWTVSSTFKVLDSNDGWKRVSFTFDPSSVNNQTDAVEYRVQFKKASNKTGKCQVRKFKLEIGNKATDWTPAPEDIDDKFTKYSTTTEMQSTVNQTVEGLNTSITANLANNYYKKTDIDSTINGVNLKFTEQVSNTNLLPHSNPVPADYAGWEIMYDATDAYIYDSHATHIGIASKTGEERFLISPTVYVKPGEYYSLNGKVLAQTNTKGTDVFILAKKFGSTKGTNEWDYAYKCCSYSGDGNWHRFKYSVQLPSDVESFFIRVDNNGLQDTSSGMNIVVFLREFMLVKGQDFYPEWVPSPTELYTGNISLNRNGVTVSMTVGDDNKGSTNINAEGLTIYNNYGTRQAWFGQGNTAFIDKLTTNKIVEPSVVRCDLSRPLNLYCAPTATGDGSGRNSSNRASSIGSALSWLKKEYGNCSYRSNINIYLGGGDYFGADNYIGGWLGSGEIIVNFDQWACLRTPLRIEDNTMAVTIRGSVNPENWATQNNAYMYMDGNEDAIQVRNAAVTIAGLNIRHMYWGGDMNTWSNYQQNAIKCYTGARVYVTCCDIVGWYNPFRVGRNSILAANDNRGHCYTSGHVDEGGILIRGKACPLKKASTVADNAGQAMGGATTYENSWIDPKPDAPYTPPAAPTENWQTTETTFWATNLWTSPEGSGSGTNARNGCWGQGKWGSYKPHRGYATFEGVGPWCSGGRNFTVYLTMTRLNTNHGNAGATPVPKIKQGDGNFWSSGTAFARGDTKTITLPSAVANQLISGSTGTLEMWAGTSASDYSFYDNVSIRIVCEKNFV